MESNGTSREMSFLHLSHPPGTMWTLVDYVDGIIVYLEFRGGYKSLHVQ